MKGILHRVNRLKKPHNTIAKKSNVALFAFWEINVGWKWLTFIAFIVSIVIQLPPRKSTWYKLDVPNCYKKTKTKIKAKLRDLSSYAALNESEDQKSSLM